MENDLLHSVLLLLVISVVVIVIFHRFYLPSIIGYLFIGIISGPYAMAWVENYETVKLLGEIGVVFLLFNIGLDFSLSQLSAMKKTLFGLGGTQVLVGTISGWILAWSFGISWQGALIVGGALALSSTAIVVKQLTDQIELQTEHGRLAFSILLFQDIAAVPFLALIPILAQGDSLSWPIIIALAKGIATFICLLFLGRWVLRPLLHFIANTRSTELFTLTVLLISLSAAWLTYQMGLSLALGAFLAGIMLSETEFRHQIEIEIRPFKDILLGLFFIAAGMQLNLLALKESWPHVMLLLAGIIFGKGFVIFLLLKAANYNAVTSMRTAQILAQGGEFGIALLILAIITGVISAQDNQPILVAIILSMIIAPILIKFSGTHANYLFGNKLKKPSKDYSAEISKSNENINEHIVICGFGRVGQSIADLLIEQNIKYIGLDTNPAIIKQNWQNNEPVFYGNASHNKILEAVRINDAKALVICVDNQDDVIKILGSARQLSSTIPILIRANDESMVDEFLDAGADVIIPETLEAGIMIVTQLLFLLKKPPHQVSELVRTFRNKRYASLKILSPNDKSS